MSNENSLGYPKLTFSPIHFFNKKALSFFTQSRNNSIASDDFNQHNVEIFPGSQKNSDDTITEEDLLNQPIKEIGCNQNNISVIDLLQNSNSNFPSLSQDDLIETWETNNSETSLRKPKLFRITKNYRNLEEILKKDKFVYKYKVLKKGKRTKEHHKLKPLNVVNKFKKHFFNFVTKNLSKYCRSQINIPALYKSISSG